LTLEKRIIECSSKLAGVTITSTDFEGVIAASGQDVLIFADPPYYHKGNYLYRPKMKVDDHVRLASCLKRTPHKFILTYDDCEEVRSLYAGCYAYERGWLYTTKSELERKKGRELFITNFAAPARGGTLL